MGNKKKQGLKEFNIDGIRLLALNEKNAMRKATRIKQELLRLQITIANEDEP